ncbi:MAG: DUF6356 family protein [Shimia sp.]
MPNPFTDHPAEVGESYLEHAAFAGGIAGQLFLAGAAALVHALIPALCKTTASRRIMALNARVTGRAPASRQGPEAARAG